MIVNNTNYEKLEKELSDWWIILLLFAFSTGIKFFGQFLRKKNWEMIVNTTIL